MNPVCDNSEDRRSLGSRHVWLCAGVLASQLMSVSSSTCRFNFPHLILKLISFTASNSEKCIDFIGPFPSSKGKEYIIIAVDCLNGSRQYRQGQMIIELITNSLLATYFFDLVVLGQSSMMVDLISPTLISELYFVNMEFTNNMQFHALISYIYALFFKI